MVPLKETYAHGRGVRLLYKSLLQNVAKVKVNSGVLGSVVLETPHHSTPVHAIFAVAQELEKYKKSPELYIRYFVSEVRRAICLEFRPQRRAEQSNVNVMRDRLVQGIELDEKLARYIEGNDPNSLIELVSVLVEYRKKQIQLQIWRSEYLEEPDAIDAAKRLQMPPALARTLTARIQKKNAHNTIHYDTLEQFRDKKRRIREEIDQSAYNSLNLLQRYIRDQQFKGLLPKPQLLPYTDIKIIASSPSVKLKYLEEAYDWEYVEGVIKSGLAYDINKHHYFDPLSTVVNEKGPFKVQIKQTEAAPMAIPYLRVLFPRLQEMKTVALDVKKLSKLFRLNTIWNIDPDKENSLTEPRRKDGLISVKGCKGFGSEEWMYPLHHYESWAMYEAQWEYFVDGKTKPVEVYFEAWCEPLETTTSALANELRAYFEKYKKMLRDPKSQLYQEQISIQNKMDKHYDRLLKSYNTLVADLHKNQVFKHGDIIGKQYKPSQSFEDMVDQKGSASKNIAERESFGLKMELGDYMRRHGQKSFLWGTKFDEGFKF